MEWWIAYCHWLVPGRETCLSKVVFGPRTDWGKFPSYPLQSGSTIFRIYQSYSKEGSPREPWYFSATSVASPGRFDLSEPKGTCYFASTAFGTWSETFRGPRVVSRQEVEKRSLARANRKSTGLSLADLTSSASASYGITLDVAAGDDYSQTQEIARLLGKATFKGVKSFLRHFPTARVYTLGIYGSAGARSTQRGWRVTSSNLMSETQLLKFAITHRYKIVDIPQDMATTRLKNLGGTSSKALKKNAKLTSLSSVKPR